MRPAWPCWLAVTLLACSSANEGPSPGEGSSTGSGDPPEGVGYHACREPEARSACALVGEDCASGAGCCSQRCSAEEGGSEVGTCVASPLRCTSTPEIVLPPHPTGGVEWAGVYVAPDAVYLRRFTTKIGPYDGTSIWKLPKAGGEPELMASSAWPNDVAVREGEIAIAGWFGCGTETFDEDVVRWPSGERLFGSGLAHEGLLDRVAFEGSLVHWTHEGGHYLSSRTKPRIDAVYLGVWSHDDEVLIAEELPVENGRYRVGLRIEEGGDARGEFEVLHGLTALAFDEAAVYFTRTGDQYGFVPDCESCGLHRLDRETGEAVRLTESASIPILPHHVSIADGVVYFPEKSRAGAFDLATNTRVELPSFPIEVLDVGVDEDCIYAVDQWGALATVAR